MSLGTVTKGLPQTSGYEPDLVNWFCHFCSRYSTSKTESDPPKRCATPGCKRPHGFGRYAAPPGARR